MSGVLRLSKSSVALLVLLSIAGVVALCALGRIDAPTAVNAVLVLVGLYAGKVAVEDGLAKVGVEVQQARASGMAGFVTQLEAAVPKFSQSVKDTIDQVREMRREGLQIEMQLRDLSRDRPEPPKPH